jgi:hypothetical protein
MNLKEPDMDILTMVTQPDDTGHPVTHKHIFHFEDNKCILHEINFVDNHQKVEHKNSPYLGEERKTVYDIMSHKGWMEDPNSY